VPNGAPEAVERRHDDDRLVLRAEVTARTRREPRRPPRISCS
jgi:hypothetical protein